MPDWEERITRDTAPAIRAEHDLRYAVARPLILTSAVWADLGCGHGYAAADALDGDFDGRALLVDLDEHVAAGAARELGLPHAQALTADLSDADDLTRVREAVLGPPRRGRAATSDTVITCFEVVEHLADFTGLVSLLVELAEAGRATSLLSVPNDAFFGTDNPHHLTKWGEGAFGELRSLLPEGHVVAHQLPLTGSMLSVETAEPAASTEPIAPVEPAVPSHYIVAIGPRAAALAPASRIRLADLAEQRRWERWMLSDAAVLQAENDTMRSELKNLIAERDELARVVRDGSSERGEWLRYIHELEGRLGLPPSGSPERAAHDAAGAPAAALGPGPDPQPAPDPAP